MANIRSINPSFNRQRQEQDDEKPFTVGGEIVRSIGTGVRQFAQSIVELPNIFGADIRYKVPKFTEEPVTGLGKFGSVVTQIAVPYTAIFKGLSLGARLLSLTQKARVMPLARTLKTSPAVGFPRVAQPVKLNPIASATQQVTRVSTQPFTSLPGLTPTIKNVGNGMLVLPAKVLTNRQKLFQWTAAGAATDFVAFRPADPNLSNFLGGLTQDTRIPLINAISKLLATDANDSDALNRFRNVVEGLGLGLAIPLILRGLGKGLKVSGRGIAEHTPQPVREWTVERAARLKKSADRKIMHFIDAAHPFKIVSDAASALAKATKGKFGTDAVSKRALNAWQQRRMLAGLNVAQETAWTKGWYTINTLTGAFERMPGGHKSLEAIHNEVIALGKENTKLFDDWAYMQQSRQQYHTKKGSQHSESEMDLVEARFQTLDEQTKRAFLTAKKDLQLYNKTALQFAVKEGLIDAATMARYRFIEINGEQVERLWIPMYRVKDDLAKELSSLMGKSKSVRAPARLHTARKNVKNVGDDARIKQNEENPLNYSFANLRAGYDSIMEAAYHNRAKQKLYATIKSMGKAGEKFARLKPKSAHKTVLDPRTIETMAEKHKLKITGLDKDKTIDIFRSKYDFDEATDVVWINGKAEVWDVIDPLLLEGLQSMGHVTAKGLTRSFMRFGGKFKNFLTRMVTSSPTFFLGRNFARDTLSVSILKSGFIPFFSSFRGLAHQFKVIPGSNIREQMEIAGATFGNRAYGDFGLAKDFMDGNKTRIHYLDLVSGQKKFINSIDNFTQKFEMASRAEAFRQFLKEGYSEEVAAFKAREIATDFAQHGSSQAFRMLTTTVPFLNAHIQGLHRTFKAMGAKKLMGAKLTSEEQAEVARAWQMTMNMSIVGGVLLPMAHFKSEDPDVRKLYEEIPKYIKDTNFVIVTPKSWFGDDNQIYLLPKPFDFGIIPTVVEKFLDEEFIESDAMVVREYLWDTAKNMTRTRDASWVPQFARPFIEIQLNKKFTGAPIVPQNLQGGGMAERRYYTSATAIWIAGMANNANIGGDMMKSPLKVEHILNTFFGTIGGFAMDYITDPIFREALQLPDKPLEQARMRFPWEEGAIGFGKFAKAFPLQPMAKEMVSTRSENEMYDLFQKAKKVKMNFDSFKDNLDNFSRNSFNEMLQDEESMFWLRQYPLFEKTLDSLAQINKTIAILARTLPHKSLEQRNKLLEARHEITRQIMDVYFSQKHRFDRQQNRRT